MYRRIGFMGRMSKPVGITLILIITILLALILELAGGLPDHDPFVLPLPEYRNLF